MSLQIQLGSYAFGNNIDSFEISQESRVDQVAIPRRDGMLSDTAYRSGMRIMLGGMIADADGDTARATLNSLKNAFQVGKQYLTIYSDRQVLVQKSIFAARYMDSDLRRIRWEAELLADDFGFTNVNPTATENNQSASPQTNVHTNNGNLETYAVIRITAGTDTIASGVRIDNLTTGKYFTYNATITTGNWVEIDTENLTVVDQAGANKLANFQGDFFTLAAGSNSIKYTGTVTGATKPKLKLTYRDKYDGH